MPFQPLDPNTASNIDPFNVSSLTGIDAQTGIYLDADQTNSSVLIETNNTPALYIDKFQNMGINTLSPSAQLDVNSSSGSCIQLTYNNSATNKANIGVTSDGKLVLMAGGTEVNVDTSSNFNVKSHNGSSLGLMLGNSLVLATADQLNFNVVSPGTASNSKALVLNSSGSISGINSLSASQLVGTLQTSYQPNLQSVDVFDVATHNGVEGLSLGGTLVTATAEKLNYVDTTPGTAAPSKAVVLDSNRAIQNINSLSASQLTGTLQTATQPNVTKVGTLLGLDVDGSLTGLTDLSINTTQTGRTLVLNDPSGNCFRMYYDAETSAANYTDMLVDGSGNLLLTSSGGNVDVTSHDGASIGLKLGGVLVTAAADQINYLQGTTPGSATAGKAMIIDSNRNIASINMLTASSVFGTLLTPAQPNIASVNALNIATHNGSTLGLKLNGTLVTATAAELNYVDTTQGVAEASKALVVDSNIDIAGINSVSATSFVGTIQTSAQPNVTSVGTLDSVVTSGTLTMGSTTIDESEIAVLNNVTPGSVTASKAIIVNANKDVVGIHNLTADQLTGTLQTASQPNITSVSTLNITSHDGTQGFELNGSLVTASAEKLNYVDTTPGTAEASKALVVDSNKDVTGIHALTAAQLTGTLQTAAQPNVTSVGTLSSISTSGDLTMGSTTISEAEIKVLDDVTPGMVKPASAIVVDANKDISSFRNLSATNLTGTLQTAAQPNVTSVSTLDITDHDGSTQGLKLGGTLLTATAAQINSIFGAGGTGTFNDLAVTHNLTLANADGSTQGLILGSTLLKASGTELNYLDGSTPGSATASNAVVLDSNKDISGISSLSASQLTGTLQTANQPNVTSVGTLSSISTSGSLTMGSTTISESEIEVLDAVTPGTVTASKAIVVDSNKDISSFRNLTATSLTGTTVTGTLQTASQPNVTSVGTLSSITTSGTLTMGTTTLSQSEIAVLDAVVPGTAAASKALVTDSSNSITGISSLSSSAITLLPSSYTYLSSVSSGTGNAWQSTVTGTGGLMAYSPTLNRFIVTTVSNSSGNSYQIIEDPTKGYSATSSYGTTSDQIYVRGIVWNSAQSLFYVYYGTGTGSQYIKYMTSPNGYTWTTPAFTGGSATTGINSGTAFEYHAASGHTIFMSARTFYYSADGRTFTALTLPTSNHLNTSVQDTLNHTLLSIGNYVVANHMTLDSANGGTAFGIVQWTGTTWTVATGTLPGSSSNAPARAYHPIEDRLYILERNGTTGTALTLKYIDAISTLEPSAWTSAIATMSLTPVAPIFNVMIKYLPNYDVIVTGNVVTGDSTIQGTLRIMRLNSKAVTFSFSGGGSTDPTNIYGYQSYATPSLFGNTLIIPSMKQSVVAFGTPNGLKTVTVPIVYSAPQGANSQIVFGSTTITENEIGVIDNVTEGTVAASKAVVVDSNKDITAFRNLTATNLTGTLQTAAQPNVTSVGALTSLSLTSGGALTLGSTSISESEIGVIDAVTAGTVAPSKAVVVDGNKDISSFRNLTSVNLTSTAGSLTMGATNISESEISVIDAVTPGTAAESKAVVLDSSKNVSGINSLSSSSLTSTAGSLTMGATSISESEISVIDAVTPGTAAESKAVVLDSSKNVSGINSLSSSSLTSTAGSLTMGATAISESEIGVLDAVSPGVVSASKAVVVDSNKDISEFRNLTATNLTGTIQTAAQPNIKSVGTLDSLAVTGDLSTGGSLIVGSTTISQSEISVLDEVSPGTVKASSAVVVDVNKDISTFRNLTATNLIGETLTGTLQTASQPNLTSVGVLDVTAHDGSTQGLKLAGVLLKATAGQLNAFVDGTSASTFYDATVTHDLTLSGHDGVEKGLILGSTLVTATGDQLNYVDTTPGTAQASKALVFDSNVSIGGIQSLTASNLTGTLQTAAQPNVTSVSVLDVTAHDGATQGLKLGGVLLTATATQINSIFGAGGTGTFQDLAVNHNLTLANANGVDQGLVLGSTLVSASGTELNYLDGSTPGSATASNALVLDSNKNISGIQSLSAADLTGTLQTAAQPNITSVGTLTSLAVAGDVTVGTTTISETEIKVLDSVVPGTVKASSAVVVDANKDISTFRNLTALNLIATDVTGTLQTAAQPNITSVGELTSLNVAGDVNVGGSLNVGGTIISENEIVALDNAVPGTAEPNKAMITNGDNSIGNINSLTATKLTGTIQTAAQPNITSVGELTSLSVAGQVHVGGSLVVGGTFISEAEILALDQATPGQAENLKALITDDNNSIAGINALFANTLTGTLQTASQPNVRSVTTLDITAHDGSTVGLELGGTLVTASATELNYVDTTVGVAHPSKALILDSSSNISGINDVSLSGLIGVHGSFTGTTDSTSASTGALVTAGGVGIAKSLTVGANATVDGQLSVVGTTAFTGDVAISSTEDSTSTSTGALTTAGGLGITKSLFVGADAKIVGDVEITGSRTQAGVDVITNDIDSASPSTGSLITAGGVGIAKALNVGSNAAVGGTFAVSGTSSLTGSVSVLSTADSTSSTSGSIVAAGGIGVAKNLNVGHDASVAGNLAITGTSALIGSVTVSNITESTSTSTGSIVTAGGVGVAKNLHVGGVASVDNSTDSISASTGALVVAGGVGVGSNLYVGGSVGIEGSANVSGSVVVDGGVTSANVVLTPTEPSSALYEISVVSDYVQNETGAGYQWYSGSTSQSVGDKLMTLSSTGLTVDRDTKVTSATDSTSTSTGSIVTSGGVGIAKSLTVGTGASVAGNVVIGGTTSQAGVVSVSNATESTSTSTGAIVTAGGVGIAKSLTVGADATVEGDLAIVGSSEFTGIVSASNVADSTSTSTGALVTAGGVGIAKALTVGTNASVTGNVVIGGTTSQAGVVSVSNATNSTSTSTGSIVTAGGVGIAKALTVGATVEVGQSLDVAGASDLHGAVTVSDETESTNTTTGSIVTAGGVGIAKSLNVGGVAKIANATSSTSATTGAFVVSGGAGISENLNIGGNVGVAGNINLIGDINLSGKLNSTNLTLTPDANSPFSTLPLTAITNTQTILAINYDAGIGHIHSADAVVVVPELLTTQSIVYYGANGEASWSTLGLAGSALSTYNSTYSGYGISISQLVVNSTSGTIWTAGSFSNGSSYIPVVLSGTLDSGISTLRTIGSLTSDDVNCSGIATASDSKIVVLVYMGASSGQTKLYRLNTALSSEFQLIATDSFSSVSWCNGLDKYAATRSGSSSIYTSTDSNSTSWVDATTPTSIAPYTVCFNTTLNIAIAVGSNFIWYSNNGTSWTNGTYQALAGSDVFNAVVNSPVSGLLAVYSNINNTTKQLYYSIDGLTWTTITLTETFGYSNSSPSTVAYDATNRAYAISNIEGSTIIQKIGPINSSSMTYGVGVISGYMQSASAAGYKWFNNSTETTTGMELMQLDSSRLEVSTIQQITNTTDSSSSSTGSLVTSGGVGIAKSLTVGSNVVVGRDLTITGTTTQSGRSVFANTDDSTSTSTGAIVTAGGVGIAKALNVGTTARVNGDLTIAGTSTLTGTVSVLSSAESSSISTGSFTTAGGVGVAKSLRVGIDASVAGNLSIVGTSSLTGVVSISSEVDSSSALTGALVTTGGVGVGASLTVGQNAQVNGDLSITGTTTQSGIVSITNLTDSTVATEGSLVAAGGVGIAKSLTVGQNVKVGGSVAIQGALTQSGDVAITSTTSSTSASTGSLVTSGGVGIAKTLNVGMDAAVGGSLTVSGFSILTNTTDASSTTSGSFTTAGGVGIAQSLHVGTGIYGTIQTQDQPNISSVTQLNITSHDSTQGLRLGGMLVTSSAAELNYLHGSTLGSATAGNALVVNLDSSISGINSLSASKLTGTIQTEDQPNIKTVQTLNVAAHDGVSEGLELGGVLLTATSAQLNSLVAGSSNANFATATVAGNLTLSGANGSTTGLVLGSTLVTSSADQLNYVNTTPGTAEAMKALVLDFSSNISGINSLTASQLTGTLQTSSQPNLTSVTTLNITGHNGSTAGLQLGGSLVTSTATQLNYTNTTPGTAQASKALVLDMSSSISGINSLTATDLSGTLQTAAQPNITSVGSLTSLSISSGGALTMGSTVISETDIAKIHGIANGTALADKALVLDSTKGIAGINSLSTTKLAVGTPLHSDMPLEVGSVPYIFTGAYSYMNAQNAHGLIEAGMGVSANYSGRLDGRLLVTGEVECTSDRRMKKNITDLDLDMAKRFVKESRPIRFNWNGDDEKPELGWVAQEVLKSGFTDLVSATPYPGLKEDIDEDGFVSPANVKLAIATGKVIPMLTMTTKDLYEQNEAKDAKIASLEDRIAALEAIISSWHK